MIYFTGIMTGYICSNFSFTDWQFWAVTITSAKIATVIQAIERSRGES